MQPGMLFIKNPLYICLGVLIGLTGIAGITMSQNCGLILWFKPSTWEILVYQKLVYIADGLSQFACIYNNLYILFLIWLVIWQPDQFMNL